MEQVKFECVMSREVFTSTIIVLLILALVLACVVGVFVWSGFRSGWPAHVTRLSVIVISGVFIGIMAIVLLTYLSLGSLYGNHVQVAWLLLFPGSNIYRQFRKEGRVTETDFDMLPWENQDSFFRMHPTVDRATTGRIEEYAEMLEQNYPWMTVIGSVFRPWTHYAHYPFDRVVPTSRRGKGCDAEKPSIRPEGFWKHMPPALRRFEEGD